MSRGLTKFAGLIVGAPMVKPEFGNLIISEYEN